MHYDNAPDIYYTIHLEGLEVSKHKCKQITSNTKKGKLLPFDKDDKVLYIKNIDTKIYDIVTSKNKTLYKIKYNDKFKLVKK